MEDRLPRKLAAILYADVAGYSRLTGDNEDATHRTLGEYLDLIAGLVAEHQGQVMHYAGDAVLARFDAVVDAVSGAVEIQRRLHQRNELLPQERRMQFRVGINVGDVIEDRGDIYGDGVNVAARLESLAEPGGVCVSEAVRAAIGRKLPIELTFLGEQRVKNITEPVRAYRVVERADSTPIAHPRPAAGLAPVDKPSLAVKPFTNLSSDPEQDYFADGLTADIMAALVKIQGMFLVMDFSASMTDFKQSTVHQLATRLGVRYVLKGGVRKHGQRVRVNAELVDVSTGQHLWAEHFDRDFSDLFAIQDEITEEIAATLDVKLLRGEGGRVMRKALRNPAALERLYRGLDSFYAYDLVDARRQFEEAIELESDSAIGYAMAALACWWEAAPKAGAEHAPLVEEARRLALRALELGDTSGYPQLILAQLHLRERNYEQALTEASEAVLGRPSCPGAYATKASVLNFLGRPLEAIDLARYAVRLQPVYPSHYLAVLASALHNCGRYQEAVEAARGAIAVNSAYLEPYLTLAASSVELGHRDDAAAAVREVLRISPGFQLETFLATQPYQDEALLERLSSQLRSAGLS